jgi:hypothetical protein
MTDYKMPAKIEETKTYRSHFVAADAAETN